MHGRKKDIVADDTDTDSVNSTFNIFSRAKGKNSATRDHGVNRKSDAEPLTTTDQQPQAYGTNGTAATSPTEKDSLAKSTPDDFFDCEKQENDDDDRKSKPAWMIERENNPDIDGGWGWWVVMGSFIIHVIADGITYSFGIIIMELNEYFGTGKGETSWVVSLMIGITFASGPAASIMTNIFGCRVTSIVGAISCSIGFALSVFATNIYSLYITYGLFGGIGFGFIYLPGVVIVSQYFEKKRSLAMGVAVCGSGMGTFIFAPLIRKLVDEYAWRGTSLILSALLLNCACCGALFRPLPPIKMPDEDAADDAPEKQDQKETLDENKIKEALFNKLQHHLEKTTGVESNNRLEVVAAENAAVASSCPNLSRQNSDPSPSVSFASGMVYNRHREEMLHRQEEIFRELEILSAYKSGHVISLVSLVPIPEMDEYDVYDSQGEIVERSSFENFKINVREAVRQLTDFALLKSFIFMMFSISNFFTATGLNVPYIYLADMAECNGIDKASASFLISVIGIGNTIGRLLFGFIADIPQIVRSCGDNGRLVIFTFSNILNGIFTISAPFMVTYPLLVMYALFFGILIGTYITSTAVVLVDLIGLDKLTSSFGLLLVFQGAATFIGPPIAGWTFDGTNSYDISFYVIGAMLTFSGMLLLVYFIPCVYTNYFLPNVSRRGPSTADDDDDEYDLIDPEFVKAAQIASRRTSIVMLEPRRDSRAGQRRASILASAAASRRTSYATERRSSRADRRRPSHMSGHSTADTSRRTSIQDWQGSRPIGTGGSRRPSLLPVKAAEI
ncbi:monocarboxylate transporter 14-like [Tubulanus polymorphus]|uniref:monocarboxylate transporter 14-like n=1 Tax=Tubulanus polymorphus TaxID=672921 RepID=UPI003DA42BF7